MLVDRYEIHQVLGSGSFGIVVSATHIKTQKEVAIKLITKAFKEKYNAKKIVSEIQIMRKLSSIESNVFTTHVFDIIIPEIDVNSTELIEYIFIVMDREETDLY